MFYPPPLQPVHQGTVKKVILSRLMRVILARTVLIFFESFHFWRMSPKGSTACCDFLFWAPPICHSWPLGFGNRVLTDYELD